ncbi:unnamed protein product [Phytophthora lilii]|uniref:Unnamed protein product n=1 Tax=Phytophthora lilii TaxID=2077276 RepID=A0A9W6X9C0_9STRA|nr:unnamed protein product [Phytophthora lilii]
MADHVAWILRRLVNGSRAMLLVGVVCFVGLALLLDEMNIVLKSQKRLQEALGSDENALTQDAISLILNGGTRPSLVQRFIFDAPSGFIQWLSAQCGGLSTKTLSYTTVAVDRRDFLSPLWSDNEKFCAATTLKTIIRIDEVVQPFVIGELVAVLLQVIFTGVFLAICDPLITKKMSKKRRNLSLTKSTAFSPSSSATLSTSLFTRILVFGTAVFGSSSAIASTDLLHFCSIADFHALFTWIMVVCLVSGMSALLAALFVGCGWKQQLAGILLVLAVGSEVFMLAELVNLATRLINPDITTNNQEQTRELREIYVKVSAQTCSSIKRWISHVCVEMSSSENPDDFNSTCQHEFIELLLVTFNFAKSFLAWSIAVKLILLVQLILPALRQAVVNVLSYVCCISSGNDFAMKTLNGSLRQASPPLDYDDALQMYLTSMRVRDPGRLAAEREAFEKEWSLRTGRTLADVRTPNVVVSSSDFGAIVRTLMLRRLTAICKLDVSLSVTEDGQKLAVNIFASDNLLLATLCETETYHLQFADAIDPGRYFWCNKQEVNADQKVLDANTVKQKLKLLLTENAMPPKEAVWFPGESLARVSARVHALSRISRASRGLIRCHNPAPAFASYSPNIQRQFIYKKYPHKLDIPDTYRRSAVLRTVDCIRVTRRIINSEFDMNAAVANGLVSSLFCLHSASRFDLNSRGALASSWITFWLPVHLPGEFWPDDHAILNLIGRVAPFRQPLQSVRDYFGELVAFYFAWFAFYAKMLTVPAVAAIIAIASQAQHSLVTALWNFYASPHNTHTDNREVSEGVDIIGATLSLPEMTLSIIVIGWGFVFAKLWERKSVWYQLQWGVDSSDAIGSYHCESAFNIKSTWSELNSLQRRFGSWLCILLLGSVNLLVVLSALLSQGLLVGVWGEKVAVLSSCIFQSFLIQFNGASALSVAQFLSRWENPHLSSNYPAYRNSVVVKLFVLQLLNTYTGLILLMLSSVGGLGLLMQFVAPLRSLYESYNAQIEGHVGIFIQIETLLIAHCSVQLSVRAVLILSSLPRLRAICRWEQSYSRREHEDERLLSPYPGPDKDYARAVMQLGLVVMFSGVCPLLPLIALVDNAAMLRQNALELCCIRQRPEPDGVTTQTLDNDDIGLGLWAPCAFLMLKISVPVALALIAFTAENYANVSVERRVGWWLIAVLGVLLVAQLFWFLIPRESRLAEEARARNSFLVERYFGHAEILEQKAPSKQGTHGQGKRLEEEIANLQEPPPSVEQSLHHYEERLELLQRLNVALRKREEIRVQFPPAAAEVVAEEALPQSEIRVAPESSVGSQTPEEPSLSFAEDEALQRVSDSSEEMIVGYFRPVRGTWSPSPTQRREESEEIKEEVPIDDYASMEVPPQRPPRRGSVFPGVLPLSELKVSDSVDDAAADAHVESGSEPAAIARPAPMRLSKLFKRMPPSPSTIARSSLSDEVDSTLLPLPSSPLLSSDSAFAQPDLDPGVLAPTELVIPDNPSHEGSRHDILLEEEKEALPPTVEESTIPVTPGVEADVESTPRPFSPRLSFLTRRSKSSASIHSDDGSNRGSQNEAREKSLLRQLSPRLSFLSRNSMRSSSKVSGSESSVVESEDSPAVPEPPAPRKLSKLFKRIQPPSTAATPPPEPPPPIVTEASTFARTEIEDRTVNPVTSLRDQFDFLSDACPPRWCRVHCQCKGDEQVAAKHDRRHRRQCTRRLICLDLRLCGRLQIVANSTSPQTNKVRMYSMQQPLCHQNEVT